MDILTLSMSKAYSDSKGGYVETKSEQILPKSTHNFELQDGFAMVMIERNAVLYEGQSCTVLWDGKTYNCNVFVVEESTVIGNAGIFTGESGGEEPFFISFEEGVIVLVAEIAGEHTVSVFSTTETIVPIDQKYLHKKINLADYGVDLLAVANSGQNQVSFEAPGLRDAIGDGTNVIFVNPSGNLTLMARPTLIMRGDGFVRFQISLDYPDDNSHTVMKFVFGLGFGDAFADMLIVDLYT